MAPRPGLTDRILRRREAAIRNASERRPPARDCPAASLRVRSRRNGSNGPLGPLGEIWEFAGRAGHERIVPADAQEAPTDVLQVRAVLQADE